MQIDSRPTGAQTLQQIRRGHDKHIQSVFSEILQNAGHSGYASAEVVEPSKPIDVRLQETWTGWYRVERLGRYQSDQTPQDLGQSYGAVLAKAYQPGA